MLHKLAKATVICLALSITSWIGYGIFRYFTYAQKPVISMLVLENNGSYQNILTASLTADHDYKIRSVKLVLDGKPFEPTENERLSIPTKINAKRFSYPFSIDTTSLSNGKHLLEAFVTDGSYKRNTNHFTWQFYADNIPLKAAFIEQTYKVDQGRTLHLKINVSKSLHRGEVTLFSKTYTFSAEGDSHLYECFIPIGCEQAPGEQAVEVELEDAVHNKIKLTTSINVVEFPFKKQRGFQVSDEKLEEEKEVSLNAKILDEALEKWLGNSPKRKLWSGTFILPMEVKRITTPHGEIRMTPARGRYLHKGIDLVNAPKSVVWASQIGTIIIKERYLMSGNTVVIDHGLGVFTKYYHLDSFADIEVGDVVKKGNPIGRVGMTGYASGYHLHWELTVQNISVDPLDWTTHIC